MFLVVSVPGARGLGDLCLAPTEVERRPNPGSNPTNKKKNATAFFFSERAGVRTRDNLIKSQVPQVLTMPVVGTFHNF